MTAKGNQTRNAQFHKRKERKRLKRKAIRATHDIHYRNFKGNSRDISETEKQYQEAMEREKQVIMSKNLFVRQLIKLKLFIQKLWKQLNLKK